MESNRRAAGIRAMFAAAATCLFAADATAAGAPPLPPGSDKVRIEPGMTQHEKKRIERGPRQRPGRAQAVGASQADPPGPPAVPPRDPSLPAPAPTPTPPGRR